MFSPTHLLISRTKQTPVQLVTGAQGCQLYTEAEWQSGQSPAFELRSKLGLFCRGIPVVGFRLEPIATAAEVAEPTQAISLPQ